MWSPQRQEGNTKIIGPAYTVKYERKSVKQNGPSAHYVSHDQLGTVVLIFYLPFFVCSTLAISLIWDCETVYFPLSKSKAKQLIQYLYCAQQIDDVPAGSIIFISAPSETVNAVYGGLMTTRAKALGVAGTIIDGRLRDLQEHRNLEYPVGASFQSTTVR